MGSNYGWSLVVRCRSGFLARVRDRYRVLATELGFEGHMGMKPPPTEKTAVTIPVQCHRSSRAAHGADFTVLPICWQIIAGQWT